ncbi:MAG: P-loop NTPase fold protein [Rhodopila sp.]
MRRAGNTPAASAADVQDALKQRDKAMQEVVRAPDEALSQTLIDSVNNAYDSLKPDLAALGPDGCRLQDDVTGFVSLVAEVQRLPGQLRVIWTVMTANPLRLALTLAAGGLALVALSAGPQRLLGGSSALAALVSFTAAAAPAVQFVRRVLKATAGFANRIDDVSKDKLKALLKQEADLKARIEEANARRAAMDRAEQALARYVDPAGTANPPRLLRFVLEDDPDTKVLEQEIGLISRARRLFQAVDEIVRQGREAKKALAAREAAARAQAAAGAPRPDEPPAADVDYDVPDRIVLYIDDLDRCTHEQVYKVLQAIHLLLAFDLFVVVVGVDVAWVQSALETQAASEQRTLDPAARAVNYLEKIFQLPFWLRPLSTAGEGGGSYAAYIHTLLPEGTQAPDPQADGTQASATPAATTDPAAPSATAVIASRPEPAAAPPPKAQQGAEETLATVLLTVDEVRFLAGAEIGALAARNPRGVKRLANVYRMVRARLAQQDEAALLGRYQQPPTYPLLCLLAAVENGQPAKIADTLYDALRDAPTAVELQAWPIPGLTPDAASALDTAAGLETAWHAAFARRGASVTAGTFAELARAVRRYSFNAWR